MNSDRHETELSAAQSDRRAFLATAGKLAVGVPPTLIVLLSTSMSSSAIAQSSGTEGNNRVGESKESGGRCWYRCGG